jgi:hypothetical protein
MLSGYRLLAVRLSMMLEAEPANIERLPIIGVVRLRFGVTTHLARLPDDLAVTQRVVDFCACPKLASVPPPHTLMVEANFRSSFWVTKACAVVSADTLAGNGIGKAIGAVLLCAGFALIEVAVCHFRVNIELVE